VIVIVGHFNGKRVGRRIAMMWIAANFPVMLCEKAVDYGGAVGYVQDVLWELEVLGIGGGPVGYGLE
jgi:hypothetical protein